MVSTIKIKHLENSVGQSGDSTSPTSLSHIELRAALSHSESITLKIGCRTAIPTGIAVELPDLWEAQVLSDNLLSENNGVCVLNSPGTIDADYRGEIFVILINFGNEDFVVNRGTIVGRLRFSQFVKVTLQEVDQLGLTLRARNGLGSTGK